jgi:hypothetical protein
MNTIVGVYESHDAAVGAVKALENAGYAAKNVSLISKAELINDHIHVKSEHTAEKAEMGVGLAAGSVIGILTGIGIFAIPGLGFLYGAGALVGAIAGLEVGAIGGGVISILTSIGVDRALASKYEKHLNEGKYLVFVQGTDQEVKHAHEVLHTLDLQLELDTH